MRAPDADPALDLDDPDPVLDPDADADPVLDPDDPDPDPDPDLGTDLNLVRNSDLVSTPILTLAFSLTLAVSMASNNGQRPALCSLQILR